MSERDSAGYYALLGLTPDASPAEVDFAYESALKAADANPGAIFIRKSVETAYGVLGDPTSRTAYDPEYDEPATVSSVPHVYSTDRDPKGLYQILGVSMDATQREISLAYHLRTTPGPACILDPEQVMTCHHAFQVLGDPVLRKGYDPLWVTHLQTSPNTILIKGPQDDASRRMRLQALEAFRRHQSLSPANQRRVTNSPFGCLGLMVPFVILLILL